ncbi:hypothetical protein D3C75_1308030 [compost metagenome]
MRCTRRVVITCELQLQQLLLIKRNIKITCIRVIQLLIGRDRFNLGELLQLGIQRKLLRLVR